MIDAFGMLLGTLLGSSLQAAAPETLYYQVRLGGIPVGENRSITQVDPEDGSLLRSESLSVTVQRGGQSLSLRQSILTREDPDGRLLRLEMNTEGMGPRPWRDRIVKIPPGWERTRNRGDGARIDTLPAAELAGPVGMERRLASGADSLEFTSPDEATLEPHPYGVRSLPSDAGLRVFEVTDRETGLASQEGRDPNGRLVWAQDPLLGWRLERVDRPGRIQDPKAHGAAAALDLFDWRPIPFRGVSPPSGACRLLVRFHEAPESGGIQRPSIPEGPGQAVEQGEQPATLLIRIDPPAAGITREEDKDAWRRDLDLAASLAPGVTVDADRPELIAFAARACQGAGTPLEEALRLERAVHDRIREDDLETAFATASQTLASRSGDCTEHAVLLAACLRSRGIPARLVAGLVPSGSKMLYHLWTEAYLGGWVPLDATRGEGRCAPCALALARWNQPEDGLAEFYITMSQLGGRAEVEVVAR